MRVTLFWAAKRWTVTLPDQRFDPRSMIECSVRTPGGRVIDSAFMPPLPGQDGGGGPD